MIPTSNVIWPCGHRHSGPFMGQRQPAPGVCCQATQDGGTICSDGFAGPAG